MCREAGELSGIPLYRQPGEPIVAWVKFGPNVTIDEALTQDWVAKQLDAKPETIVRVPRVHACFTTTTTSWSIGYIVMEYVDAPDCTLEDFRLVAQAVQTLISVRGPSSAPGHVGGGLVVHNFFVYDETSPFIYKTVDELESHVNGILRSMPDTRRVNLVADASDGLFLCPCDIHPGNFKKLLDGTIVAIDFHMTCFLPPSFFAVAMRKEDDLFAQMVAKCVKYPRSSDVGAILSASYYLVSFQRNDIGEPDSFSFYLG
ncbi:hypothetical protein BOTBODRAFT_114818 [Botryobasidium botryosum FD-172 SS1]|uniref:Aminoglycoside phosphotransferase domain-containing protein n=1 Tax=Botryobasidium botryosum (strain FD-172 SS1) TaxID=930990 RepID=A0A067M5P1_BOTB1|nr:hypothetical protein BOTBODRAFT_114818 [Botryobasidium botryosum FD-172 SS1]